MSLQIMACNSISLMRKLRHREVKWQGNTDPLSRRDLRINIGQKYYNHRLALFI